MLLPSLSFFNHFNSDHDKSSLHRTEMVKRMSFCMVSDFMFLIPNFDFFSYTISVWNNCYYMNE